MALGDIGRGRFGQDNGAFPILYQELIDIGEEVTEKLKKSAKDKGLDASGELIAGIRFETKIFATQYVFELIMPDYYKAVDEGRKPGKMPPLKPIIDWIKSKGIKVEASKRYKKEKDKAKRKTIKQVSYDSKVKSLAFLIARSIGKHGTIKRFGYKGSKFYSNVVTEEYLNNIQARLSKAAKKDIIVEIQYFK